MSLVDYLKTLPQQLLILALLAMVGVLGASGHLAVAYTYAIVMAVAVSTGIAAGVVVGSTVVSNKTLLPHLLVIIACIGVVTALGYLGVFNAGQILAFVASLVPGGTLAVGNATGMAQMARAQHLARPGSEKPGP